MEERHLAGEAQENQAVHNRKTTLHVNEKHHSLVTYSDGFGTSCKLCPKVACGRYDQLAKHLMDLHEKGELIDHLTIIMMGKAFA